MGEVNVRQSVLVNFGTLEAALLRPGISQGTCIARRRLLPCPIPFLGGPTIHPSIYSHVPRCTPLKSWFHPSLAR